MQVQDKTYIIAPKGVIPSEEIPKGIGFYEVDLNNYRMSFRKIYKGITLVKRASTRHKKRHYRTRMLMFLYIAQRATNMDLYKNCKIDIYKRK